MRDNDGEENISISGHIWALCLQRYDQEGTIHF